MMALSSAVLTSVTTCCQQLLREFPSQVFLPRTSNYTAIETSYWSLQEAAVQPACIVVPKSTQDVSKIVSLTFHQGCPFAVKGNTHAPAAGFANIENGITVDMTGLQSLSLNEDRSVLSIGGGANWLRVYAFLDQYNLAVAGGRNGLVGVGGLALGGGISHYAARQGFACDNVVKFELVTSSGVLEVDESHELFRSLKGGGNNFGIVTRFDMRTFSQGDLHISTSTNNISYFSDVATQFSKITGAKNFDPYTSLVTSVLFAGGSWSIGNSAVYTKPVANPAIFRDLLAIPSIKSNSSFERPYVFANETNTPPLNWLFWTGTYGVSSELMVRMFNILNESVYNFDSGSGLAAWSLVFEPLPTKITDFGRGSNSLDIDEGNSFIILLSPLWTDSTRNEAITDLARKIGTKFNAAASSMGLLRRFQYLNYADTSQHPIASYGPASVARLRAASRKYDPQGVFQKLVPGGFKLP